MLVTLTVPKQLLPSHEHWKTNDHGCGKNHFLKLLDFHVRAHFISYAVSRAILEIFIVLPKA